MTTRPTNRLLVEQGRQLASRREDLIAAGADPSSLEVPLHPDDPRDGALTDHGGWEDH